jgi:hypothetical protein
MKSALPGTLNILVLAIAPLTLRGDERNAGDEKLLKAAGLETDGPALLRILKQRTLTEADQARLAAAVRRLGADSFRVREQAARDLRAAGPSALPFARPAVNDTDSEVARRARDLVRVLEGGRELGVARAVARLLAVQRPAGTAEVVLGLLPFADGGLLEEELLAALVAAVADKSDPAVAAAVKDPAPARRGAAAWVLGRSARANDRAMARPLLADPDPRVRFRAARALLDQKEKEAVPALVALLGDAPHEVGWEAEDVLFRLAGQHAPAVAFGEGSETERRTCRTAWEQWWRDRQDKLDLSTVEFPERRPGHVMFACYEGYQGKGRVWEVGANGQTVWQLDITGPSDVQVLPGNRYLISEYFGEPGPRERDATGKVLWKHRFINNLASQRLPSGNTFMAGVDELVELSPQGKPVFSFWRKSAQAIFCARRLRDGNYAYACQSGQMIELDRRGETVRSFPISLPWCATFDALPNGHYLVPQSTDGKVVEFDRSGKVVWECHVPGANTAARLPDGRTFVGTGQQSGPHAIVEVDRWGQVVSEQPVKGRMFRIVGR